MQKKMLFISRCSLIIICFFFHNCSGNNQTPSRSIIPFEEQQVWKEINHVVVVVLENTDYSISVKLPYLSELVKKGSILSSYFAIQSPSQPNYIALTSGSLNGITDNTIVTVDVEHIGDLLEAKKLSWKVYADDYPGNCFTEIENKDYVRRHNPFISYRNVQKNLERCNNNIMSSNHFHNDLKLNRLSNFSFYVPNNQNNGHDTTPEFADNWIKKNFDIYFNNPEIMRKIVFIITYDEGKPFGENKILTLFIGQGIKQGFISSKRYNHYSLIRTIEEIFSLGSLHKEDYYSRVIDDIWNSGKEDI